MRGAVVYSIAIWQSTPINLPHFPTCKPRRTSMNRTYSPFKFVLQGASLMILTLTLAGSNQAFAASEKVLYAFTGTGLDGGYPSGLIFDSSGNLYGATSQGGTYGRGTVFELSPSEGSWTETILYSFGTIPNDGYQGVGALIFDAAGNLYGTTYYGGGSDVTGGICT